MSNRDLQAVRNQTAVLVKIYTNLHNICQKRHTDDKSDRYALGKADAYHHAAYALNDLLIQLDSLVDGE